MTAYSLYISNTRLWIRRLPQGSKHKARPLMQSKAQFSHNAHIQVLLFFFPTNTSRLWKDFGPRTEKAQRRSALPLCRPVGQSCALWSELWWWCGRQRLRSGRIRDRLEVWEVWGRPLLYSFYSHHSGNNGGQPVKTNGFCEGAFFRVQNPTSPPLKLIKNKVGSLITV